MNKPITTKLDKDELSTIRHEIKNHLAVISGYAQLLQLKVDKVEKPSEAKWVETILNECEKLLKYTDTIR